MDTQHTPRPCDNSPRGTCTNTGTVSIDAYWFCGEHAPKVARTLAIAPTCVDASRGAWRRWARYAPDAIRADAEFWFARGFADCWLSVRDGGERVGQTERTDGEGR